MKSRAETEEYVRTRMLFMPRFLRGVLDYRPEMAEAFADFYEVGKRDRALTRKMKEMIFLAIGVAGASPACLIHVAPAVRAGATSEEIREAALVGMIASAFRPDGPGLPRAAEFMAEVCDLDLQHRQGRDEVPDYVLPPRFQW